MRQSRHSNCVCYAQLLIMAPSVFLLHFVSTIILLSKFFCQGVCNLSVLALHNVEFKQKRSSHNSQKIASHLENYDFYVFNNVHNSEK